VSCDFSEQMVKKLKETYAGEMCDFSKVEGNKVHVDTSDTYMQFTDQGEPTLKNTCDLDKIIAEQGDFRKFVFGCRANNELLPFPS